ncbi:MAG: DUF433 domain-containing protein [Armatimonadota bacterium]|nr:DUF433 domain-containing protein [Armatimonadota bacterium]
MDYRDYIVRDAKVCGGEPVLKGTRVTLRTVLASLAEGSTASEIQKEFPSVSDEHVKAAIALGATRALENPWQNSEISYDEHLVAFIDILGFKKIIEDAESDLARARHIIANLSGTLRQISEVVPRYFPGPISVRMFSDCVVVSCALDHLNDMLYELAFMQWAMAHSGFFVRGGIVTGKHFENDLMIFSHGLVEAFEFEREKAIYPRIVVDPAVAEKVKGFIEPDYRCRVEAASLLEKAPDGLLFVDYLEFAKAFSESKWQGDYMRDHRDQILQQIRKNLDRPRIVDKYRWLAEYHNEKFKAFFSESDWGYPSAERFPPCNVPEGCRSHEDVRQAVWIDIDKEFPGFRDYVISGTCGIS